MSGLTSTVEIVKGLSNLPWLNIKRCRQCFYADLVHAVFKAFEIE